MDFPKGCSSNVHLVENLAQTRFMLYGWKDDDVGALEKRQHVQDTVKSLRERNVLCLCETVGLWVFGELEDEQEEILKTIHPGLVLDKEGKIEEHAAKQTSSGKHLKDFLLDAIECAIAFDLAKDEAVVRIAPWTWLYCCRNEDEGYSDVQSTVMKLHTRLTSPGGLYLVPQLIPSSWIPAHTAIRGTEVETLIAPNGRLARTVPDDIESKTLVSGETWRSQVRKALLSEGIEVETDEEWWAVHFVDVSCQDAFEWPMRMCFVCDDPTQWTTPGLGNYEWSSWFTKSSSGPVFRNPLAAAEEWFLGAAARDRVAQQNGQVDSSVGGFEDAVENAPLNSSQNGNDTCLGTSPIFNQRNLEQQAAMTGIYPTPPDGLMQSQQMPNLNAVTTPSVTQAEQGSIGADLLSASDDVQFKGASGFDSSAEPESYQMGQEDLFGDVGEMEFGEHEVGDDDFSFFDEPDEDPVAPPLEDIEMMEAAETDTKPVVEGMADIVNDAVESQDLDGNLAEPPFDERTSVEDTKPSAPIGLHQPEEDAVSRRDSVPQPPEPEKPLSPFGIRERLLPPPVPASVAQSNTFAPGQQRRNSTFSPIAFRDGLHLGSKYADAQVPTSDVRNGGRQLHVPDISLPSTRKKSRLLKKSDESDEDSESEEDSYESESDESDEELPPKLPWDNRKRKRHIDQYSADSLAWLDMSEVAENAPKNSVSQSTLTKILEECLTSLHASNTNGPQNEEHLGKIAAGLGLSEPTDSGSTSLSMPFVEDMYDLKKDDLVCIAQIIGEASVTAFESLKHGVGFETPSAGPPCSTINDSERLVKRILTKIFPEFEVCDLGKVALTREPPPRPGANPGKTPQGQPRPPQRSDSMMLGPDYFPLPAPYVKIQRGVDNWEMLPTSLSFWEPLGLGPASGPKNVRAFCLFPGNEDLQHLVEKFIVELGAAFESCKLGSHVHLRNASGKDDSNDYERGMAPIELGDDVSLAGAFKAYAVASSELGKTLSSVSHDESDRTIVVYMVNPFQESSAMQHLCACFWLLFKAYRDNLPKARRNQCGSDIVLQILPIDALASFEGLIVPDAKQMAMLAREVYDRCPPSNSSLLAENMSPLPILVAPSVESASAAPKRIGFQLTAEPPGDLLHEGSVLHLAYAISTDRQWLTAAWIDSTGQHQSTIAFCLRGRSFAEVAEDVWERTREIIAARQVTWRIFILTTEILDQATSQCWRTLSSKPRQQPVCVTMLSAQADPAVQLYPPVAAGDQTASKDGQDAGFLTPASTPQGNNFISSPDVSGYANAPLTPAPSETAASIAENDPDAHLTDVTDETWGVLLTPKITNLALNTGLANGILFKRGDVDMSPVGPGAAAGERLPSLGTSLHWTIQVKPSGGVDEGSIRQAELTLRELLKLYRNLALLTKAKGLEGSGVGLLPLHVAMAVKGARGVDGMLAPLA